MRRLPASAHAEHPWLVHEITGDFVLEDVWALPTPGGGPDDFPLLVSVLDTGFQREMSAPARLLWWLREKLGSLLRLDQDSDGLGTRVQSLRDRLPADLRAAPEAHQGTGFTLVYAQPHERVYEIANRTVHGVAHFGWVPDGHGAWRGQMAVLVKPNGRFGAAYMAFIKPFRHLVIYPTVMRSWERNWRRLRAARKNNET